VWSDAGLPPWVFVAWFALLVKILLFT